MVAKEYTLALDQLLKAAEFSPNDSKVHNNLGMAYFFKEKPQEAIHHLKKSIKLNSKNTDALNNLASIYKTQKKIKLAQQLYEKALKDLLYTSQFRVHYNLALIRLEKGQTVKAVEHLKKSVELNNNYCPAYFKLGQIAPR